ncbi:hypothetical protein BHE74_00025071 [Ensete ventricosum]|nr:hypothetical protein GW17_00037498 [Ensete ventricosum]RWW67489.1 hypothetical protein BHE74_00025071 [Ensete ventricosum]RZR93675.1 hypothetical protein BHM03_00022240 [Ensete ventricosum]
MVYRLDSRSTSATPLLAGLAVAAAALAGRYGIQAWHAYKARPVVPRMRKFYEAKEGLLLTLWREEEVGEGDKMDDYAREMMDLKTLVTRTLEKKGVLAKIRVKCYPPSPFSIFLAIVSDLPSMIGFRLIFVVSRENEGLFLCFSSKFGRRRVDFFLCFVLFVCGCGV